MGLLLVRGDDEKVVLGAGTRREVLTGDILAVVRIVDKASDIGRQRSGRNDGHDSEGLAEQMTIEEEKREWIASSV
jgi:hypothetical protein